MKPICFYIPQRTGSIRYAAWQLEQWGFDVRPEAGPDITHVLLPIPSSVTPLPSQVPENALLFCGGKVDAVQPRIDLLQDEEFLACNAAITAQCAVALAMEQLPITLDGCPVLVVGWGRIGKCLAKLLRALGANVTVAARSSHDRAMLAALGYPAIPIDGIRAEDFRLIVNTVPAPVLGAEVSTDALQMDLASRPGLLSPQAIRARSLPGRVAPESAGALIARTIVRYLEGEGL